MSISAKPQFQSMSFNIRKQFILPLLLPIQILVVSILAQFPEVIETYYSNGIYPIIAQILRMVFGWIPIAVGDLLYFAIGFLIVRWFWKIRKTWRILWKFHLLKIVSGISIFYFAFNALWALNYHRMKLVDKMELGTEYSDEQLLDFTKKLIIRTNAVHSEIESHPNIRVTFPYSQEVVFDKCVLGYQKLSQEYEYFEYQQPSIKKSVISLPLTIMGFAGYLNPFTNEANVNAKLPMYTFPATTSHEMAHQIGYASESEANFVGYLAAIRNDDKYIRYSGYTMALRYCLRSLERRDKKTLEELLPSINRGVLQNLKDSNAFWEKYQSFVESGFEFFYDNFLKLNRQEEGLDSYSRFVDLMINYYEREKF